MTDLVSDTWSGGREAEKFVRFAEEDYRRILHDAPMGVFQCTPNQVCTVNSALAEMLGWDSADKLREDRGFCTNFLTACGFNSDQAVASKKNEAGIDSRVELRRRDGSTLLARLTLKPVKSASGEVRWYEGFVEDLTELEALREKLRRVQELALRGQLASGIAHDFNNILSATLIHLGLLLPDPDLPVTAREGLQAMRKETKRAADLTRQLLSFSRRSAIASLEPVEMNALIGKLLPLLRRLARENILVVFLPAKEECWVKADEGLIEMLVMHLCLLSRYAMPQGGTLTLAIYLASETDNAGPPRVCLAATQARPIPQKSASKTGALVASWSQKQEEPGWRAIREIVALHNGRLEMPNPVEASGAYRIIFPGAVRTSASGPESEGEEIKGGSETVLLIEDERYLRRMSALCLRKLGYAVLEAGDDEEALKLWEKHRKNIDVVIADFLLPGLSTGLELSRRMEKEKPSLKIILASGQGADFEEALEAAGGSAAQLSKPYNTGELARTLRRCLDQPNVTQ
jgi:PAS domain S-box-containing protein